MAGQQDISNNDFIELQNIDTDEAAKKICEYLAENKTYFLNGEWGTGKSEFLINVKRHSKKKFTVLDLWRTQDERSVITIAFCKLRPILYWTLKVITLLSVVTSILMTNIIDIGMSQYVGNSVIKIAGVVALTVSVWSFFKIKSDAFYVWILKIFPLKRSVLIVDDFDRIDAKVQEQIYILFNILESRMPIVFIGDYYQLARNNDKFLQKIISQKIELPYALHPNNIWNKYFDSLKEKLNFSIPEDFRNLIIEEQRNLRERKLFNDYVNNEFFIRNKLGRVQPYHQLLVIYTYLFYPNYYTNLASNRSFDFSKKYEKENTDDYVDIDESSEEILQQLLYSMQRKESEGYPYPFLKNREGYLLYEVPSNLTVEELDEIIRNENKLKKALLEGRGTDFNAYIQSSYPNFSDEIKQSILDVTLILVKQYKFSDTIDFIMRDKNNELMPRKKYLGNYAWGIPEERAGKSDDKIHEEIFNRWHSVLEKYQFEFSQEIYVLLKYSELYYNALGKLFPNIELNSEEYAKAKRKDLLLNIYVSSKHLWGKFDDWTQLLWQYVNELDDTQYISFWIAHGILKSNGRLGNYQLPASKEYTILLNKRDLERTNDDDDVIDFQPVIDNMEPRLKKLRGEKYNFVESKYK